MDFNDTSHAFAWKTDKDLEKSYLLFKVLSYPQIVKLGGILAPVLVKTGFTGLIRKTLYKQFIGGESREDCREVIELLGRYGIGSILDYSVEGKEKEEDFERCVRESLENIEFAKNNPNIPFCVFKVTGLTSFSLLEKISSGSILNTEESQQWKKTRERVRRICQKAYDCNVPILIDAEESWIQQAIDDLAWENMLEFNKQQCIVYNTYQFYRHDRLAFFQRQADEARKSGILLGAKFVRGAYMEKERARALKMGYPSPIQPDKASTDRDFDAALHFAIQHPHIYVIAGTHNEKSSLLLCELMNKHNIDRKDKRYWFSQLFGMSDHISFNLAAAGYNVVKYLPYGPVKDVLPYLIRRAQENTSVKGQTSKELELIRKEKIRRYLEK